MYTEIIVYVFYSSFLINVEADDSLYTEKTLADYVLWDKGIIPFYINKEHFDAEQTNIILSTLQNFEVKTCLKFVPFPTKPIYMEHVLLFENPKGLNRFVLPHWGHSNKEPHRITVGYKGLKPPYLNMLIMKALGLPYEHNRKNRESHIYVHFDNIEPSYYQHYVIDKQMAPELALLKYDYNSVTHFKSYQFSKNGQRTYFNLKGGPYDEMSDLTPTDLLKINLVYGPQCQKRDRDKEYNMCKNSFQNSKRNKRSVYAFPRKSLRVNPEITPPPLLDSAELDRLNMTDVVKEITDHVRTVSGLIVKIARAKFCNSSIYQPYEVNDEKIKEAVSKIEHHAQTVIEQAQSNKDFCDVKDLRCGYGKDACAPPFKSTKSGMVRHSTQFKAIPLSTNIDRIKEKKRLYYPFPHLREGNAANVNETDNGNVTVVKEEDEGIRPKREADNDLDEDVKKPSRRLVKKSRTKTTLPPSSATSIKETVTSKVTEADNDDNEALKLKADDKDYEEDEEADEEESDPMPKLETKATPAHQKRFKKKYEDRPKTDNKEPDTADFNQHQTAEKTPKHEKKINKQGESQKHRPKKTTPAPKKKYDSQTEDEEVEDEASGVKTVKVIMEYNKPGKAAAVKLTDEPQITGRQDDDEQDSGSDVNEVDEGKSGDDDGSDQQPAVVKTDNQINTPSPEIFVNEFKPEAISGSKKIDQETSEDDTPLTTRQPHQAKKAKPMKSLNPAKPLKTRIVAPGAPNYQSSSVLPKTVKLNKKNLEFYNERKWNDPIIAYVVTEYAQYNTNDLRRRLNEAIKILKKKTCVRLQEVSSKDAEEGFEDYLVLDTSPDYVTGRVGGKQHFGSIELFEGGQHRQHAAMVIMAMLGFYFEVARHDRDEYVRVHLRHVRADKLHHFEKIRDDATFPLPYDYKSATHPAWQFWRKLGKKGISTIATYKETDPSGDLMKSLGQNPELFSEYDIIKINTIYGVDCFAKSGLIRDT